MVCSGSPSIESTKMYGAYDYRVGVGGLGHFAHKMSCKLTFSNAKSIREGKKNGCHRVDDSGERALAIDQFVVVNGTLHITRRCGRLSSHDAGNTALAHPCVWMWFVWARAICFVFDKMFLFSVRCTVSWWAATVSAWIYAAMTSKRLCRSAGFGSTINQSVLGVRGCGPTQE